MKCGLGPALLNLHDEGLDKKAFLQQAAEIFSPGAPAGSIFPIKALADMREELNRRVREGCEIVHPAIGVARFSAQAGVIRLRRQLRDAPSIEIANCARFLKSGCIGCWPTSQNGMPSRRS